VISLEGDNLVVFYMISLHLKSDLTRGVAFLDEENLVVFYLISLHQKSDPIRRVDFGGNGLSRCGTIV
jgi:hypothetical protein